MAFTRSRARHLSTYLSLIIPINTSHSTIGEYIGHLEPAVLDSTDQQETHQTNSVTLKKMMPETVTPNAFNPPCHELSTAVQNDLKLLLQEYESQFHQR